MTTKEVLQAARDYIADPKKWIMGTLEDQNGAVCAAGAIYKVKHHVNWNSDPAVALLASVLPPSSMTAREAREFPELCAITYYNDNHNHACVLAAFDAAIERAEP